MSAFYNASVAEGDEIAPKYRRPLPQSRIIGVKQYQIGALPLKPRFRRPYASTIDATKQRNAKGGKPPRPRQAAQLRQKGRRTQESLRGSTPQRLSVHASIIALLRCCATAPDGFQWLDRASPHRQTQGRRRRAGRLQGA